MGGVGNLVVHDGVDEHRHAVLGEDLREKVREKVMIQSFK